MSEDVLNAQGAADLLGVSIYKVYAMCGSNEMPHRRVGKLLRFSRGALMRWLEGERRTA